MYEVKISKEQLLTKPKLSIQLKTGSQKEYIFEDLTYDLPSEDVSTTELPSTSEIASTTSQASVSQTSETSLPSTSWTETSQTTSREEGTSQEQTSSSQNGTAVKEAAPTVALKAQEGNGKFDIALTNISKPTDISSVQAAVWSEKNGQDDLKWYTMPLSNASASLTVDIKNHSNQSDNYIVHIYIHYKSAPALGINAGKIAITKPAAKHQLDTAFAAQGLQVNFTSNQVSDYGNVRFAIWGEKNGQDDLKWYTASSTGTLTVPYKQLAGFDKYQVHAYLDENGKLVGLKAANILLQTPAITTTISKVNDTQYKIEIKNVPTYISTVSVPVWSEKNGQDDLKWYTATKNASGVYQVTVRLLDHHFDTGKYQAHVYGQTDVIGSLLGLGTTAGFTVTGLDTMKGNLSITNVNNQTGQFDVVISDVVSPGGLKEILVPVWSKTNGQDDLRWYTARRQTDGSFKVTVSAADHQYTSGEYLVHAYYVNSAGKLSFLTGTSTIINLQSHAGTVTLSPVNPNQYTFTANMTNVGAIAGVKAVKVAVWSEAEGQNDLRWYVATQHTSSQYSAIVRLANHYFSNGIYHVHVYYELNNGKIVGLSANTINVTTPAPRAYVQQELATLVTQFHSIFVKVGGKKSLYIAATDGVDTALYNDSVQRSASTIKLFIMAAAFAKANRGELNMNATYTVQRSDIVQASVNLSNAAGKTYTLAELTRFIVETSDNTATNIVMRHIGGVEAVNAEIRRMGYTKTYMQRYMHDAAAINAGLDNYINAQEAGDLIRNIYNKTLINSSMDGTMIQNLSNNYYPLWLPATIRSKAFVIDKPGNHGGFGVENDIAVISKNGRAYAVAVLTEGTGSNGLTHTQLFAQFGEAILAQLEN